MQDDEATRRKCPEMPSAIQSFCNNTIEDIRSAKAQQWNIAYYALLLLGAIYVIHNDIKATACNWERVTLSVFLLVSVAVLFMLLRRYGHDIEKYRDRLSYIYNKYIPEDERNELKIKERKKPETKKEQKWTECISVFWILVLTNLIAALTIGYVVWRKRPI